LINPQDAARMGDAEALDLIFRPGFSTAEVVTEVPDAGWEWMWCKAFCTG